MAGSAVLVGLWGLHLWVRPDDLTRAVLASAELFCSSSEDSVPRRWRSIPGAMYFHFFKGLYEDGATVFMCHYRSVPENLVPVYLSSVVGAKGSVGTLMSGRLKVCGRWAVEVDPDTHHAIVFSSAFPARPG